MPLCPSIGAPTPKQLRGMFPVPCCMLFTICPGVTALGARTFDAPEAAPVNPGGGDLPRVVFKRSCRFTFMPPRGMPPGLFTVRPAGLAGAVIPIGEGFRCKPLVVPIVLLPDFIGIVPPTLPNDGEGDVPQIEGLAGKTTTLAPEVLPLEDPFP